MHGSCLAIYITEITHAHSHTHTRTHAHTNFSITHRFLDLLTYCILPCSRTMTPGEASNVSVLHLLLRGDFGQIQKWSKFPNNCSGEKNTHLIKNQDSGRREVPSTVLGHQPCPSPSVSCSLLLKNLKTGNAAVVKHRKRKANLQILLHVMGGADKIGFAHGLEREKKC